MPASPPIIFAPPAAGAAPTAPVIVFQPAAAPVNQIKMTGGSFLGSGQRIFNPQAPAYEAGFTTYTAFDSSIYHYAGKWVISFGEDYTAEISSTAASPVGLTGWTILTGIGNPTIVELFVA